MFSTIKSEKPSPPFNKMLQEKKEMQSSHNQLCTVILTPQMSFLWLLLFYQRYILFPQFKVISLHPPFYKMLQEKRKHRAAIIMYCDFWLLKYHSYDFFSFRCIFLFPQLKWKMVSWPESNVKHRFNATSTYENLSGLQPQSRFCQLYQDSQ